MGESTRTSPAFVLFIIVSVVVIAAMIVIPNLIESRVGSPEAAAIGSMKSLGLAQSRFRAQSPDLVYGTLAELSDQELIDAVLGSGTKSGYHFAAAPGTASPQFVFWATATPSAQVLEKYPKMRRLFLNHEGVTYYTTSDVPAPITSLCAIPPGWRPVGK